MLGGNFMHLSLRTSLLLSSDLSVSLNADGHLSRFLAFLASKIASLRRVLTMPSILYRFLPN